MIMNSSLPPTIISSSEIFPPFSVIMNFMSLSLSRTNINSSKSLGISESASLYNSRELRAFCLASIFNPLSLLIASSASLSSGFSASIWVNNPNILLEIFTFVNDSSPWYLPKNLEMTSCPLAAIRVTISTTIATIFFIFFYFKFTSKSIVKGFIY